VSNASIPAGFVAPSSLDDVDVQAAIAQTPTEATVKGVVIQALVDLTRAHDCVPADPAFGRRWLGFKDHSVREYMHVAALAARALHPQLSMREGLRAVGHQVFEAFMQSLSGRVLFGVLKHDVVAFMGVITRAYKLTQSHGRAKVIESSPTHALLEYSGLYQFLDALEVGVVEAGALACAHDADIFVRHDAPGAGAMYVQLRARGS
jgi:uncharacterized protein (TIGR02265 family)